MKDIQKIFASKYWWLLLLVVLVTVNFFASLIHSRVDLTKEKRYSLSNATKELLRNLDDEVRIDVYLKGDFPANFRNFANNADEFLMNCKEYSRGKLTIKFVDPFKMANDSAEKFFENTYAKIKKKAISRDDSIRIFTDSSGSIRSLIRMEMLRTRDSKESLQKEIVKVLASYLVDSISDRYSISRFTLDAPSKIGDEQPKKDVLPGASIHYQDTLIGVDLLKGAKGYGTSPEELAKLYNDVEATLEYKFASAIQKIVTRQKPVVAYALGHGEGWGYNVNDAFQTLRRNYNTDTFNIKTNPFIPSSIDGLVILKPTIPFTDEDKLKIDQYVMAGGKVFWMIDKIYAEFDSLYKSGGFTAFDRGLNLDDMLFKYGVRINPNLLQDMQCDKLDKGNQQQPHLVDWPFFPVLEGTNHPISKNLDGVRALFPSTIDTIQTAGVKKTFLLRSSRNARILATPAIIDFEFIEVEQLDIKMFGVHDAPVAVLLEGKFTSLFRNRISRSQMDTLNVHGVPFKEYSDENAKMIVVADGDIAGNHYNRMTGPLPMGMSLATGYTFANKDFFINSLEYLVNPSNILETRAKDFTLRLLDPIKVKEEKTTWQFINIALPVLLVILFGFIYQQIRKRKYTA